MATFKIVVLKHHERTDGKFRVSIRVTWLRQSAYLATEYYLSEKQITKDFEVKDSFVLRELNNRIVIFEELKKTKLGSNIYKYTAKELVEYFSKQTQNSDYIDFFEFSVKHFDKLKSKGRESTCNRMRSTINGLKDYVKHDKLDIKSINSKFLYEFEEYLLTTRKIKRLNQFGKEVETIQKPLSRVGIKGYMTDIRTLFNAAKDFYNDYDKDEVLITHYPFERYKIAKAPANKKKALEINTIKLIRDMPDIKIMGSHGTNRATMARDLFMLSFYLCGMNAVDLYQLKSIKGDRVEYERSKTKDRRSDFAFISIKIQPEALPLIEKYKDSTRKRAFIFHEIYADSQTFDSNIGKGLKQVSKFLNIEDFTYYAARHSWATIARNECGVSLDDVHMSLNHSDSKMKVTDGYIKEDWSIIDNANRKVIDKIID